MPALNHIALQGGVRRSRARGLLRLGPRLGAVILAFVILPVAASVADASTSTWASNCTANIRSGPTVAGFIRTTIPVDSIVTVTETVAGGAWKASCGASVSGRTWLRITSIDGRSSESLFGVVAVYAASGLFRHSVAMSEGVDFSSWQGPINFATVRAAGKRFVLIKATEGNAWTDPRFAYNRNSAIAAGLEVGAYHFARPTARAGDAVSEADHFIAVMGLRRGMLVPALDLEVSGGLSPSALIAWTKAFVGRVDARLGVKPMIYAGASFWQTAMAGTAWFGANGYRVLWIAGWNGGSPSVPGTNWGGTGWTFWQYSDCGQVPGITGCVDLDRFKGTDFASVTY